MNYIVSALCGFISGCVFGAVCLVPNSDTSGCFEAWRWGSCIGMFTSISAFSLIIWKVL